MAAAAEAVDDLIEDIHSYLGETSARDLFSASDVADHLLDFANRAADIKSLLNDN